MYRHVYNVLGQCGVGDQVLWNPRHPQGKGAAIGVWVSSSPALQTTAPDEP